MSSIKLMQLCPLGRVPMKLAVQRSLLYGYATLDKDLSALGIAIGYITFQVPFLEKYTLSKGCDIKFHQLVVHYYSPKLVTSISCQHPFANRHSVCPDGVLYYVCRAVVSTRDSFSCYLFFDRLGSLFTRFIFFSGVLITFRHLF